MWAKLEEVFEELNYPYARQGSYAEGGDIPETTFTFWNNRTPEGAFYDNTANKKVWQWYVYLYTKNPNLIYNLIDEFVTLAKSKGFILSEGAKDIAADEPNYFGRFVVVDYIEKL